MARLKLYGSDHPEDSVEIIALLSRYTNKDQHEQDKIKGFEILDLLEDGSGMVYFPNKRSYSEYGFSDGILKEMVQETFNDLDNGIEITGFYYDNLNECSDVTTRYINNFKKAGGRNSRRYMVVEYCGRFYLTDVVGMSEALHWYKDSRDNNETSLQWGNYITSLKTGSFY